MMVLTEVQVRKRSLKAPAAAPGSGSVFPELLHPLLCSVAYYNVVLSAVALSWGDRQVALEAQTRLNSLGYPDLTISVSVELISSPAGQAGLVPTVPRATTPGAQAGGIALLRSEGKRPCCRQRETSGAIGFQTGL